jgi:hypothetical protein
MQVAHSDGQYLYTPGFQMVDVAWLIKRALGVQFYTSFVNEVKL